MELTESSVAKTVRAQHHVKLICSLSLLSCTLLEIQCSVLTLHAVLVIWRTVSTVRYDCLL